MLFPRRCPLLLAAGLASWLCGCGEPDVHVYRATKEPAAASGAEAAPAAPANRPEAGASLPMPGGHAGHGLLWKAPEGWTEFPGTGMRVASFRVPAEGGQCDLSIVALPGPAGGLAANINRWRGQIGLEPLDDPGILAQAARVQSKAGELIAVDFIGTPKGGGPKPRVLGAMLSRADKTWFFKLTGDEGPAGGAKEAFLAFLRGLTPL